MTDTKEDIKRDKVHAEKAIREAQKILAQFLSSTMTSTPERGSDVFAMRMDTKRVLIRIRRQEYESRYAGEFTIRYKRRGGTKKIEFQRIMEGGVDYLFYGFSSDDGVLISWVIGDFRVFRAWIGNEMVKGWNDFLKTHKQIINDGTEFLSIQADEIPGFVVYRSPAGS